MSRKSAVIALFCASTGACAPLGEVEVTIYGEEFIEAGIGADEFADGWAVTFERFDVSVHKVDIRAEDTETIAVLDTPERYDLSLATDGAGQVVADTEVMSGVPLLLSYQIAPDAETGCALLVEGSATKAAVSKSFSWCLPGDTTYVDCETVAVASADVSATTQITVHADHLFYDDLVSTSPNVAFALIAEADANDDGEISEAELRDTDITGEARYQVGNADVSDLWAFLIAQSRTVGHIDGEGHCARE